MSVWNKKEVVKFIEENLGLRADAKIKGRIVEGHDGAYYFWEELLTERKIVAPFEVIHIDSHADLGIDRYSVNYICDMISYTSIDQRPFRSKYYNERTQDEADVDIGDYLLFAISNYWISKLTYHGNPARGYIDCNHQILKNFKMPELSAGGNAVTSIQLLHTAGMEKQILSVDKYEQDYYLSNCEKDCEIPFVVTASIDSIKYSPGEFDYIVIAHSPDFTPASADFILEEFKKYIEIV